MRTLLQAASLALMAWAALPAGASDIGQAAPDFRLATAAGELSLADTKGKLVYLDFWASWCGPCKQSFPWMNEMQARYGARGLRVVGVNVDNLRDDATRFLGQNPASFTIAFDPKGDTPRRYAVKAMPTSVLIGPDGKVLAEHRGFDAEARQQLEQSIVQALARLPANERKTP